MKLTDSSPYTYETFEFPQVLDHFNFHNSMAQFQQRYLVNKTFWHNPTDPIFFYTGNEGSIDLFAQNTGFMWDIAPQFNAMLVFAEHRYYGTSMPFGNSTFNNTQNLQWLTSEQALADFATLIPYLKQYYNAPLAPIIVFGGSYGGMLSAWFRMKYPHLTIGAIASSAPVLQFAQESDPGAFAKIVTDDFQACKVAITKSWSILTSRATTQAGLLELSKTFSLCQNLTSASEVENELYNWLSSAYTYMAMGDYPYPSTFLGPMPASPVTVACNYFTQQNPTDDQILQEVLQAVSVFYNYSGQAGSCFDVLSDNPPTLSDLDGWDYQSCTEMIMPMSQDGQNDMFWPRPWNLTEDIISCQEQYGITPRPDWIINYFGGSDMLGVTNLVFSNGDLDPWRGGGVMSTQNDQVTLLLVTGGAHHLDLRSQNPADPQSVISIRQQEVDMIHQWINNSKSNPLASKYVALIAVLVTLACVGVIHGLRVISRRPAETTDSYRPVVGGPTQRLSKTNTNLGPDVVVVSEAAD